MSVPDEALVLANQFHTIYERLAPSFGYETRTETRLFSPSTPNGKLMVAVCVEIMEDGYIAQLRNRIKDLENEKFIHCGVPLGYHPEEDVTEWCDKPSATGICGDHWNEFIEQKKQIKELEAEREWQPIETAPDDKLVLVFSKGYCLVTKRYSLSREWLGMRPHEYPTHWMPLPEPPK